MNMMNMVKEEFDNLNEGYDYQRKLGQVIASTQQIIDKANQDDIIAIEPQGTWESMYKFQKISLMNTRLRIQYMENNGRGWENKSEDINLTQDRNINFEESKAMLAWVRKSIKKGYTYERRDNIKQDKLNQI